MEIRVRTREVGWWEMGVTGVRVNMRCVEGWISPLVYRMNNLYKGDLPLVLMCPHDIH